MQRPIRPEWLLRQADELAGSGRGQPRNADLRRAASAAYYALFHAVSLEVARSVLHGAEDEETYEAARLVAHGAIRDVCGYVASGSTAPRRLGATVERLRDSVPVVTLATDFLALNEAREEADYDHLADFTRPRVRALIERASQAVALLTADDRDGAFVSFLGLVALRISK